MSPQKFDFFNGSRKKPVWSRDLNIWDSSIYPSTKNPRGSYITLQYKSA